MELPDFWGHWVRKLLLDLVFSLALGGLAQMLTPIPEPPKEAEDPKRESYSISGIVNTSMQGIPVPVIYGEIIVGSALISLGIKTEDIIA